MALFVIVTGGTGGHLYPALSCAEELKRRCVEAEIIFFGSNLTSIAHTNRFPSREIAAMALSGHLGKKTIALCYNIKGLFSSFWALCKIKPRLLIAFGSYATVPTLVAARLLRIPFILHEANSFPGKATRCFAPYAAVTALHFPQAASYLTGSHHLVQMPLREALVTNCPSRTEALQRYHLSTQKKTCLVMGGSQGSQAINRVAAASAHLLSTHFREELQFLHLVGPNADVEALETHYRHCHLHAAVRNYEDEMKFPWQAADIAICRGGASTLAESRFFGVPLIVIPYPHATDNHQEHNARALMNEGHPTTLLLEKELAPEHLAGAIEKALAAISYHPDGVVRDRGPIKSHPHPEYSLVDLVLETSGALSL